jgi:hypothetical protein
MKQKHFYRPDMPEPTGPNIRIVSGRVELRGTLTTREEADELIETVTALKEVLFKSAVSAPEERT